MMNTRLRLGVNIDHVATLRNARGGAHPDPLRAAQLAESAGADGITIHLREDRRHIRDEDVARIKWGVKIPINFEMAATEEMRDIALRNQPHAACIVPERREEVTTEGGLDVAGAGEGLFDIILPLTRAGIRTSLFIDPEILQVEAAFRAGARVVELHTGAYCEAHNASQRDVQLSRLQQAAAHAHVLGLEVHAGHGISYENVTPIAQIPSVVELNIGHFLIGEAMFVGLPTAMVEMRKLMDAARGIGGGGMILGIGTDMVDIRRIEKAVARQPQRFLTRIFTPHEISQALTVSQGESGERKRHSSLAKRFAAKEAVLKSLGLGFREGIRWRDIEVRNDAYGAPILKLYGKAKEIAASRVPDGMQLRHHLSLTDEYPYAQAFVILEAR